MRLKNDTRKICKYLIFTKSIESHLYFLLAGGGGGAEGGGGGIGGLIMGGGGGNELGGKGGGGGRDVADVVVTWFDIDTDIGGGGIGGGGTEWAGTGMGPPAVGGASAKSWWGRSAWDNGFWAANRRSENKYGIWVNCCIITTCFNSLLLLTTKISIKWDWPL